MESFSNRIAMQLLAGFAASMSTMSAGFHFGWPAPALPKLLSKDSDIPITSDQSSWIICSYPLGIIFGALTGGAAVERYGRKLSLLASAIPYATSCALIGLAQSYWWFNIARFIGGLGSGMSSTIVTVYLGEIAEDKIRGALVSLLNIMVNFGILVTYSVGPWVDRAALAGIGGSWPLIFGLMFIWMPESPYYLVMKGDFDRAEKSLRWLRRKQSVNEELAKVQESVEFDKKNAGSIKDLVMVPGNRKALIIVSGLMAAQQCSGISIILAYGSMIFEASGSTLDSSVAVIILGTVQIISVVLTSLTVDLAGRRLLLLASAAGSSLFLGGVALYFHLQASGIDVTGISWLPITASVGFIIFYTIGLGALPFVVISELFPYNIKGSAAMVGTSIAALFGLITVKVFQAVADEYGIGITLWAFVVITVFSFIFIYYLLPETRQRSFISIQNELHKTTESTVELSRSEKSAL